MAVLHGVKFYRFVHSVAFDIIPSETPGEDFSEFLVTVLSGEGNQAFQKRYAVSSLHKGYESFLRLARAFVQSPQLKNNRLLYDRCNQGCYFEKIGTIHLLFFSRLRRQNPIDKESLEQEIQSRFRFLIEDDVFQLIIIQSKPNEAVRFGVELEAELVRYAPKWWDGYRLSSSIRKDREGE
jgi:hypothetical protein